MSRRCHEIQVRAEWGCRIHDEAAVEAATIARRDIAFTESLLAVASVVAEVDSLHSRAFRLNLRYPLICKALGHLVRHSIRMYTVSCRGRRSRTQSCVHVDAKVSTDGRRAGTRVSRRAYHVLNSVATCQRDIESRESSHLFLALSIITTALQACLRACPPHPMLTPAPAQGT